MLKQLFLIVDDSPRITAWTGVATGWLSVDLLRYSQIFAALAAGAVSVCALILTAPKAYREVQSWFRKD